MTNRSRTTIRILASLVLTLIVLALGFAADAQARGGRGGGGGGYGGGRMAGGPGGGRCISFDKCYNHCFSIGGISGDSFIPEACSRVCARRCNGLAEHAQGRF